MKALLKIDCQGTATDPESRGGDSRLGQVQMVVTGHKAKKPQEGRQSRERQAKLIENKTLKWNAFEIYFRSVKHKRGNSVKAELFQ
jgi:hypothetical protein